MDISRFSLSFDFELELEVPLLLDRRNRPEGLVTAGVVPLPEGAGTASSDLSMTIEGPL